MSSPAFEQPHPVAGWHAYYPEQIYTSFMTVWEELPDEGVQVIVLYYDAYATEGGSVRYRKLLDGDDFYFHVPGTDIYGSTNHQAEIPDAAVVKEGREIPDSEFSEVKQRAIESSWR